MDNQNLQLTAYKLRKLALEGIYHAKSGHPGGSLGIAEIMAALYFREMTIDPADPKCTSRDRFVLSKGHCAPALYAALAHRGYFPEADLTTLRQSTSHLQGHPNLNDTPGVDMSTGSLGQGISAACGMAYAAKLNNADYRTYTVLGDGEIEEGQVWEAAMFAAHYKLDNLCAIVDWNGLQIDGKIDEVLSPLSIEEKFKAFNWHTISIDGHNIDEILTALATARQTKGRPTAIIAKTTKGKGVSFMEDNPGWHGNAPNSEQYEQAVSELDATINDLAQ